MCPASWGQTRVLSLAPPMYCTCSAPQFLYLQNGTNNTCLFPMSQTEQMIEINVKCLEHQGREALENPEEAGSAQSISGHPTQNSQSPEEHAKCTSLPVSISQGQHLHTPWPVLSHLPGETSHRCLQGSGAVSQDRVTLWPRGTHFTNRICNFSPSQHRDLSCLPSWIGPALLLKKRREILSLATRQQQGL